MEGRRLLAGEHHWAGRRSPRGSRWEPGQEKSLEEGSDLGEAETS